MAADRLKIERHVQLHNGRMLLGLSGWMDGGNVSTGTVRYLTRTLEAWPVARIDPRGLYVYNLPGSMEVSAMVRPHTKIENGLVRRYDPPSNTFHCVEKANLLLFQGREPNLGWDEFAESVFEAARRFGVTRIYFLGTVAGVVPHTRDPRLHCSASSERLIEELAGHGIRPSDYEGPASVATYLTYLAAGKDAEMAALVAEIPAYVQGTNPRCLEAMTRTLSALLGLQVDLEELRQLSDRFEKKVNSVVQQREDLAKLIGKMEQDYDNEMFDTQMGDLKQWLQRQGIRLD